MGPAPTIATVLPGCDLAVEHAAFKAGRQDIAQHHQASSSAPVGNLVEAGIGMGNADIFRLGAVDRVAQNPAAGRAMRIHAPPAIFAFAAGGDAGDQNMVARLKSRHAGPASRRCRRLHGPGCAPARRSRTSPFRMCRSVPQIVVFDDFDDGVGRLTDARHRPLFERFLAGSVIDERFHGDLLRCRNRAALRAVR